MKITQKYLQELINEELKRMLAEQHPKMAKYKDLRRQRAYQGPMSGGTQPSMSHYPGLPSLPADMEMALKNIDIKLDEILARLMGAQK